MTRSEKGKVVTTNQSYWQVLKKSCILDILRQTWAYSAKKYQEKLLYLWFLYYKLKTIFCWLIKCIKVLKCLWVVSGATPQLYLDIYNNISQLLPCLVVGHSWKVSRRLATQKTRFRFPGPNPESFANSLWPMQCFGRRKSRWSRG